MALQFQVKKASKTQAWLRMGISGPAGSGKTYTALKVASELGDGKIIVIDTQRGQANHYGGQFDFDIIDLTDHHPQNFIDAINFCSVQGYKYIIIDSITHEWTGKNGCLELHEEAVARQKAKNTFIAWKEVTPLHNRFFEAVNSVAAHVIGTVRSKVEHVQEKDDSGRTTVRKVGMATVQREGADYELDVLLEMEIDHVGVITKCRDGENREFKLDGRVFRKPGADLAEALRNWLTDGAESRIPELLKALEQIWLNSGNASAKWNSYKDSNLKNKDEGALDTQVKQWQSSYIEKSKFARQTLNNHITDLVKAGEDEAAIRESLAVMFEGSNIDELVLAQLNQSIETLNKQLTNTKTIKEAA